MKIFVMGLLLFGFGRLEVFALASESTIKVIELKGTASERVGRGVLSLHVGSLIHQKSMILVDPDSVLIVSLGKDVVTKLGPGSSSSLFLYNKKDWELKLDHGITASAIGNPEKRVDHFRVRTKVAVMGVRGTVFYTESFEGKPDFVCTCRGTVSFQDQKGKQFDSVTATHHDRPLTLSQENGAQPLVKAAAMGNGHSDADVVYLDNLLGKL